MSVARAAALAAGLAVVLGTTSSVVRTLVVPRGLTSRFAATVVTAVRWPFQALADRLDDFVAKDRVLAVAAPLSLLLLLVSWLASYLLGFSLLELGLSAGGVGRAVREAGSSLFTLGFASSDSGPLSALDFVAAGTGPVIIALQIAYLPTLYAAYNRRETEVTLLQSRAGEPAWGVELLARQAIVGTVSGMPALYAAWERWAADVSESHTNYPVLIHFRSPRPLRHWLVGLLSVMDAAALHLALRPSDAPIEARMCLRMGFIALRDVARVERIRFDPDPLPDAPIALTLPEFREGVRRLLEVGFPVERDADAAWPHFRGWRVNYEPVAYALAERVEAPPALWSGPRRRGVAPMPPTRPPNRRPEVPDDPYAPAFPALPPDASG